MIRACVSFSIGAILLVAPLRAQSVSDFVPANAAHCAVTAPPPAAGIAATPGGFVMVHPRNEAIGERYSGCKILWVVDGDRMQRLATLYFDAGVLSKAIAHDVRDPAGAIDAVCDVRAARSLMPRGGRQADDAACRSVSQEEFYGLRLATWPRRCLTEIEAAVCKADPR
ncbi:MAG: hypothetical protein H7099_06420 [Gemmatimonadaceae bacterium]|nr:hypothetical protein [Gemmatimonadaceae bacterium]